MHLVDILIICFLLCLFSIGYKYVDALKAEYELDEWRRTADQAFRSLTLDKNGIIKTCNKEKMQEFVRLYSEALDTRLSNGNLMDEDRTFLNELRYRRLQIANWTMNTVIMIRGR